MSRSSVLPVLRALGMSLVLVAAVGCGGKASRKPTEPDTTFRIRMAQSLAGAGRVSEALATLDEAIAEEPQNAQLRHFRGQILFSAGRYAEAEAAFLETLRLDRYVTDAHNFLGAVYQEVGRPAEAEQQYRVALADPSYPTPEKVYMNLGLLLAGQDRLDEGLEALRKSVELQPKYYPAHYELATLLERMGRLGEAAREYDVAEPGFRTRGDYYYRRGLTYFRLGDRERARESLSRCLTLSPGSQSAAQADELLKVLD